jgi:excisionase family DNA binding protein
MTRPLPDREHVGPDTPLRLDVAVFTPAMLAERWLCSERHVRNLIADRRLRAFRVGGKLLRIAADAVEEFERCRNGPSDGSMESASSHSGETGSEHVTALAPMTRAKLSGLRQRSTPN